jgi:hypothetical protein
VRARTIPDWRGTPSPGDARSNEPGPGRYSGPNGLSPRALRGENAVTDPCRVASSSAFVNCMAEGPGVELEESG